MFYFYFLYIKIIYLCLNWYIRYPSTKVLQSLQSIYIFIRYLRIVRIAICIYNIKYSNLNSDSKTNHFKNHFIQKPFYRHFQSLIEYKYYHHCFYKKSRQIAAVFYISATYFWKSFNPKKITYLSVLFHSYVKFV